MKTSPATAHRFGPAIAALAAADGPAAPRIVGSTAYKSDLSSFTIENTAKVIPLGRQGAVFRRRS
jgi:hypothetical protein